MNHRRTFLLGSSAALASALIVPLHCSGPNMVTALREMLPGNPVTSTTGTEFTFGA